MPEEELIEDFGDEDIVEDDESILTNEDGSPLDDDEHDVEGDDTGDDITLPTGG